MANESARTIWEWVKTSSFEEKLLIAGKAMLVAAMIAFLVTSFITTFQGFQSFLFLEAAFVAALGLQLTLFATEIFFAQAKTLRVRLVATVTLILVVTLSIAFSYIGLREIFTKNVTARRNPIYESEEFQKKRSALNDEAARFKAAATDYFSELDLDVKTSKDVAEQNAATRKKIAENLRSRLEAARNSGNQRVARRLQRQLDVAEANANSLNVEKTRLNNQENQLAAQQKKVVDYVPQILSVTDKNWEGLQKEHQKLSAVWETMPQDFTNEHKLSPAPTKSVLKDDKIAEGEDHPTIEALNSLKNRQPHEDFALALAAMLDLIPFVALWMTRGNKKPIHERIKNLRRWMKEVKVQIDLMDGVFGWLWKIVTGFFVGRAVINEDPRIVAFRQYINKLRAEMEDFLQNASLPEGIAQLLRLKLTDLYAQSHSINFEASTKLEEAVLQTYDACLDDINSDGLDENTKNRLKDFLNRHIEKFEAAAKSASYAEAANGNKQQRS